MKKYLANIISASRVAFAAVLLFLNDFTGMFIPIYIYCGFSDLIDGPIARKTNSVSVLGAHLDTVGDVLTYSAMTKIIVFKKDVPLWAFIWFGAVAVGFIAAAFIAKIRSGKFYFVHTLFCKIMAGVFFVLPLVINHIKVEICGAVLCTVSSIGALESIIFQLKDSSNETNVISVRKMLKSKNNTEKSR
ncbi:MAG: CDP-alcohol phosphatidyltransferase family protein [Eubacteriales bacterium]|nr:CDP-alcohol phosphatidyltransferase family protein [Eubacteriales bacterium]